MKSRLLPLAALISLSLNINAQAEAVTGSIADDINQLVEQVRQFRQNNQTERVRVSLERLKRIAPSQAETIAEEALWAIHQGRTTDAERHLFRLKHAQPDFQLIPQIETLIRLEGKDKPKLVEARLLFRGGQYEKSATILQQLFAGKKPPSIDLAILYYNALAKSNGSRNMAKEGFKELVETYPLSFKAQLAYLNFQAEEDPVDLDVIEQLQRLATNSTLLPEVMPVWAKALANLERIPANKGYFEAYLQYNKDDYYVGGFYQEVKQREDFEAVYKDHPAYLAKLKGIRALNNGRFNQAIRQLNRAKKDFPNDVEILSSLAFAYLRSGQHAKAIKYFDQLIVVNQAQESKWLSLKQTAQYWLINSQARAAINNRQFTSAKRLIAKAESFSESELNTMQLKALLAIAKNQKVQALNLYKDWLESHPDDQSVAADAAKLIYDIQGYQAFERYVARLPANWQLQLRDEFDRVRARYHFEQAHRAYANQRWDLALKFWLEAIALDNTNVGYFKWAEFALLEGQSAPHLPIYSAAIQPHKNWVFAHQRLLNYWYQQGDYVAINEHVKKLPVQLRKALSQDLDFYRSKQLQTSALKLAENGNSELARLQLEQAVKLNPNDPWLMLDYGRVLIDTGQREQANQRFDMLLKQQPLTADAVKASALFYAYQNQYQKAYQLIDSAPSVISNVLQADAMAYRFQHLSSMLSGTSANASTKQEEDSLHQTLVQNGYTHQLLDLYLANNRMERASELLSQFSATEIEVDFSRWYSALLVFTRQYNFKSIGRLFENKSSFTNSAQSARGLVNLFDLLSRQLVLDSTFRQLQIQHAMPQFADSLYKTSLSEMLTSINVGEQQNVNNQKQSSQDFKREEKKQEETIRAEINEAAIAYLNYRNQIERFVTGSQVALNHTLPIFTADIANEDLTFLVVNDFQQNNKDIPNWLYQYLLRHPPIADYRKVNWLQIVQTNGDMQIAKQYAKTWHQETPENSAIRREYVKLHGRDSMTEMVALTKQGVQSERFKLLQEYSLGLPVSAVQERFKQLALQDKVTVNNSETLGGALDSYSYDNWIVRSYQSDFTEQNRADDHRFAMGFSFIDQSGSAGKSELQSLTVPMELRMPLEDDGFWFARVDPVYLNAGVLDTAQQFGSQSFGGLLLCQPACQEAQIEQQQTGFSIAAGFESEHWKADIGTTPLGFEVQDIIGGIEYSDDLYQGYWSLALEKRAVDSNLLSYAGTFAPYLQKSWGGVRATGMDLGLGYDKGEFFGVWSSFGYHSYSGENTEDNTRTRAMGGVYFRLLEDDPFRFTAGASLLTWQYEKDLGEFTFGQGGYYSPQTYASLSIPLELYGRFERLSYKLRVTPAYSTSSDKDEAFYPSHPDLQLAAQNLEPLNGVSPVYIGGKSDGASLSYAIDLEYKINRHWNIGINFGLQKAEFYQPASGMIYFKYYFEDNWLKVPAPPEPILKYTQF